MQHVVRTSGSAADEAGRRGVTCRSALPAHESDLSRGLLIFFQLIRVLNSVPANDASSSEFIYFNF